MFRIISKIDKYFKGDHFKYKHTAVIYTSKSDMFDDYDLLA